jgi:aspartate/methionine/tyrosine aminotransferase
VFSNRLEWSLEPNELARLLAAKRGAGVRLLDLTQSNPTQAGFDYPPELLTALCAPSALRYEPSPWGIDSARAAVAAEHGVDASRVMITASTSESYSYLFKLLCSPGDNVLVPKPSYPLFEFLAKLESVELRHYPLRYESGWRMDFEALASLVDKRSRAVLLVHPNNPTGSYLKRHELSALTELCERRNLAIVSDEVFSCYRFSDPLAEQGRSHDPLGAAAGLPDASIARSVALGGEPLSTLAGESRVLTFCLNGLSKMGGLPQMKAGWMILGGPDAERNRAAELLELIADTFLSVSVPIQHALPEMLRLSRSVRDQIQQRTRENLRLLRTFCEPLHVEGGWYAVLPVDTDEHDLVLQLAREDDVLVQPGFYYDFEEGNHLIVSLLTEPGEFREGLGRLATRLRR